MKNSAYIVNRILLIGLVISLFFNFSSHGKEGVAKAPSLTAAQMQEIAYQEEIPEFEEFATELPPIPYK